METRNACGTGVDVEKSELLVVHDLEDVAVTGNEELRWLGIEAAADAGIVMTWIAADMLYEYFDAFALEAVFLTEPLADVVTVDVAKHSPQGLYCGKPVGDVETADVACVPYFVALGEIGFVAWIPVAVGVGKKTDSFHLLFGHVQCTIYLGIYPFYQHFGGVCDAEMGGVDAEVVAGFVAPLSTGVEVVVFGTGAFGVKNESTGFGIAETGALHDIADLEVEVGIYEDVEHIWMLAEHIVGSTAYEDTVVVLGFMPYDLALKPEQAALGDLLAVVVGVANDWHLAEKQVVETAMVLVVLGEELFAEPALFGCKGEDFAVVELTIEPVGNDSGNFAAAAAEVAADGDGIRVHRLRSFFL